MQDDNTALQSLSALRLSVLLIDDDEFVLRSLRRLLFALGAQDVVVASSMDSALGSIATCHIDVALVDLKLGNVDGLTVAGALRKMQPSLPVVFMTGASAHQDSPSPLLCKPCSPNQLTTTLREVVRRQSGVRRVVGDGTD